MRGHLGFDGGLGAALMGVFLTVGCGDAGPSARGSDSPNGTGGSEGAPAGAPGAGGATAIGGASGAAGSAGASGAAPHPSSPLPPRSAARLLAPLSGSRLSTNQPRLSWALGPDTDGAIVELCADRACTHLLGSLPASGASVGTPVLPPGPVFWRVRGTRGGTASAADSATWEAFIPNTAGAGPSTALATRPDFDGDGFGDFLLDDQVLLGGATGFGGRSFPLPGPSTPVDSSFFVFAGDLNGDGFGDVLRLDGSTALTPFGIFSPTPLFGGATGFTAGAADAPSMPYGPIYSAGPAGDVNGDGYADFLFKTRFTPVTYLGNATGISEGLPAAAEGSQSFYAFGSDFDGDGFADAASTTNGVPDILVTPGGPSGFDTAVFTRVTPPGGIAFGGLTTIDGNGDGFADLAAGADGGQGIAILPGSAGGIGNTPIQTVQAACATCFINTIGTGDFNGDGRPDLVTGKGASPGQFVVYYGTATGFAATGTALPLPANTVVTPDAIADVNGDGFEDLTGLLVDQSPNGPLLPTGVALLLGGAGGLTPAP